MIRIFQSSGPVDMKSLVFHYVRLKPDYQYELFVKDKIENERLLRWNFRSAAAKQIILKMARNPKTCRRANVDIAGHRERFGRSGTAE